MTAPLVSICVPARNAERFIVACLDSVARDSYPSKEIVIVNDGSTDGTLAAVERWRASHPAIPVRIETVAANGVIPARNRIVALARGAFLAWVDSDDMLVDAGIQARIDYLDAHPEKLAVFADCRVIDDNGRVLFESAYRGFRNVRAERFITDRGLRRQLLLYWCVPGPVLLARRELYERIGGYDESIAAHDYDLFLRMLARNALGYVNRVVSEYRVHDRNISRQTAHRIRLLRSFRPAIRKSIGAFSLSERILLRLVGRAAQAKALWLDWFGPGGAAT